ncbi:MAG: hypothetical protein L3J23_06270 [Flavobacteriaceae bacterium]|nr:hypothetical protein [Flavobacteriaceae bacterium]
MLPNQKHIINKVYLEVNTNTKKVAYALKDKINVFLKQDIFPFIETYFEKIENSLPSEIIQIPKLNLDLTISSKNNFEELKQTIKEQFVKKIQQKIIVTNKVSINNDAIFTSKQENNLKAFLCFLEEGILPWNSIAARNNIFNKKELLKITKTNEFAPLFQQKISKTTVRNRLLNQFDTKEIQLILQQGFKDSVLEIIILNENLVKEVDKLNTQNQKLIWQLIIKYFINKNIPLFINSLTKINNTVEKNKKITKNEVKQVKKVIAILYKSKPINNENVNSNSFTKIQNKDRITLLKNNKTKPSKEDKLLNKNEIINTKDFFQEDKASYYIENAGLILLHPFLKQFFENCKLLTLDNKLKNQELAVHLLHYIATKKEKQLESNLVFEKFLCGVPIKQSISKNISISKKLKKQSEELLESVIQNWEILKNASTDLLRNEFLQRAGKLSLEGDNPKINIARKTQDILVDKLPWNISISKLPWLNKLTFTDW